MHGLLDRLDGIEKGGILLVESIEKVIFAPPGKLGSIQIADTLTLVVMPQVTGGIWAVVGLQEIGMVECVDGNPLDIETADRMNRQVNRRAVGELPIQQKICHAWALVW